jgi:aminodeoxyfutalosine deaminase
MRKISADYVFTGEGSLLPGAVLVLDGTGAVLEVIAAEENPEEVERYSGILCPGFINAHCHLELSHLKGKIPAGLGLDGFIRQIEETRRAGEEEVLAAIEAAEQEMLSNGIVAVGDISNTSTSFACKARGKLFYHTFIELLGFHPSRAGKAMEQGELLHRRYMEVTGSKEVSLVPHAPYSASEELLSSIKSFTHRRGGITTIHNQESAEENEFFLHKRGKIASRIEAFGFDISFWQPTGLSSLKSTLAQLPLDNNLQLVHNTYTSREDFEWASSCTNALWWCFCPRANLYIEGRLPDISMFEQANATIGTDSLASNHSLCILEELKTIAAAVPALPTSTLLRWATSGGAGFLGISDRYGRFRKHTSPGVNLITGIDPAKPLLGSSCTVNVLA